jgi:uncharacterized Zn-finger protein
MTAVSLSTETVYVTEKEVSCDGGKGALGHPFVYLNMGEKEEITCPYCNKHFILKKK